MKNFVKLLVSNTELYKLFKNNFTYHSSNLEGSTVTLEDNNKIINEELNHNQIMKITKEKYDDDEVQENYNNGELFDYVIKTLNEPLTIKELYV
jgi:2-hydroxy-3-keto-5-methylthiopentenyl-1-phosphate phosphatase